MLIYADRRISPFEGGWGDVLFKKCDVLFERYDILFTKCNVLKKPLLTVTSPRPNARLY